MFKIQQGISKPAGKSSGGREEKYPLAGMNPGDFFIVPQSEMTEAEKAAPNSEKKFRDRVNQAVRTYKQRTNKAAPLVPGYDEATYVPVDFTIITLGDPPEEHPDAWVAGDVGVWRDA